MPPKQSPNKLRKAQKGLDAYSNLAASVSKMSVNSQKRAPQTHFLVVLAIETWFKSEFMIGDFASIKYHLNLMGILQKNCFWSTIDLHHYCVESGRRDIKMRGELTEKVVYSEFKSIHRQDDYTKIDPKEMLTKFDCWMRDAANGTEPGDCLNIIMVTHGDAAEPNQGTLQLGSGRLEPPHLVQMMKRFKKDVQVNFVTNACGSGGIGLAFSPEDQKNRMIIAAAGPHELASGNGLVGWNKGKSISGRFRSSFFTDVIIKSLGKINLGGFGPTLRTLEEDLQTGVWDKPQPQDAKSHPQITTLESASTKLEQILHFDYVDFPFTTERANRYLKKELQYQLFLQVGTYDIDDWGFADCREEVERLFKQEIQKSDHGHAYNGGDSELLSAMERVIDPTIQGIRWKVPTIMKALELRAKIQSAFFSVFMHLNNLCLVSYEGLRTPMRLSHATNADIGSLMGCLNCFTGIREFTQEWEKNFTSFETFFYGLNGYTTPLLWLATLIVRGAVVMNMHDLLDRIETLGEFGTLKRDLVLKIWPSTRKLMKDPNAGSCKALTGNHDWPVVAFWLPHDLGQNITPEMLYEKFDEEVFIPLEDLFFRFFGLKCDSKTPYELCSAKFLKKELTDGTREF